MDELETSNFLVIEVKGRFPDGTWTDQIDDDWIHALKYLDKEAAIVAIRKLKNETTYKNPNLAKFVKHAKEISPHRAPTRTEYFIQYQGGSKKEGSTLNPGYFFQVVTTDNRHSQVAQDTRTRMEQQHGGEWRVITNTNWSQMIADRKVLSLQAKTGESK